MSQSAASKRSAPPRGATRANDERPGNSALLTPGSAVRFPVGYIWMAIVLMVGLMIGAYFLGSEHGREAGRAEAGMVENARVIAREEAGMLREVDGPSRIERRADPDFDPPQKSSTRISTPKNVSSGLPAMPEGARSLDRDRNLLVECRERGYAYNQIIGGIPLKNALHVAAEIRANGEDLGLDAIVVERQTRGSRVKSGCVMLLPGFRLPQSSSDKAAWKRRISELSRRLADDPFLKSDQTPFSDYIQVSF